MIGITIDIDWAPEAVIEYTLNIFRKYDTKCTLFCTHESKVINECERDLFEIALHPNFNPLLEGKGNGLTAEKVIKNIHAIYPEAIGVRSHAMTQSSTLLNLFSKSGIQYDCNHFLPYHENVKPFKLWNGMWRLPYIWEDDIHWWYGKSFENHEINLNNGGLKIFDFHPIHVYLNTEKQKRYDEAKVHYHEPEKLLEHRNENKPGTNTILEKLLEEISEQGLTANKISELIHE